MDPDPALLEMVQQDLENVDLNKAMIGIKEIQGGDGDCSSSTAKAEFTGAKDTPISGPSTTVQKPTMTIDLAPSSKTSDDCISSGTSQDNQPKTKLATVLITMGMAGSGKTTWTKKFSAHLREQNKKPYIVNLDPGCRNLPYSPNIDIRDTINYKALQTEYKLGPNAAMITALNMYALKFNEVLDILEKRAKEYDYILIDTPGQMECFLWSASGTIITQGLAHCLPTSLVFIMDLSRCHSPVTFTQSMLNAVSVLYKYQLPLIVAMNKIDVDLRLSIRVSEWIKDYDMFQEDLLCRTEKPFVYNFTSSLALCLDNFYQVIRLVQVSARDGFGLTDFMSAIDSALIEYHTIYLPLMQKLDGEEKKSQEQMKTEKLTKLLKDMKDCKLGSTSAAALAADDENLDDDDLIDSSCSEEDEEPEGQTIGAFVETEKKKRREKLESQIANSK